ncbi:MAG: alpha-hydroxy-acid oxidizing protein [Anaerolineae bacterium]|uniref:alpha-hydroxy acid oxidase n=1 Tax=Promineifilum sp. TaxID=2664178 RepID=UPI001DC489FB|nr:alpha-hydroxy-acid oxidizing protein [Anaerolineales bacterium]MCO5181914.1 alpha-hydroxy-acid oxidizing protein [Promineifilum sp.]MCW5846411.1 alpha-hydroxy-acid oxidizing protein [Anaerolineae bacterium]
MDPINLYDYEALAREKLTSMAHDYYASGAHDEITLRENHAAYDRIRLRYRVLRDISRRTTRATVLGHSLNMPVIVAPTAFQKLAHPDGEAATARAAGNAGTLMILSTLSTTSIEDVMAAATGPVWFQLYVYKDREATKALVQRAEAAGCSALVLTVDAQILGRRERDVRNRFQLPPGLSVMNLMPAGQEAFPQDAQGSGAAAYVISQFDQTLSWKDVTWLCGLTKLPVLLKGIVHPDDARLAVEHGAAGVFVSNHGGRQLDTAPATVEALPEIVAAVDGRIEVLVDGGIRRGTDVVKALAYGAQAVAVGRPVLWGLAAGGQRGVEHVLELLRAEVDLAMGLCGCASVGEIDEDILL